MPSQNSSPGPDWKDMRRAMTSLGTIYGCTSVLLLEPDGRSDGFGWRLQLISTFPELTSTGATRIEVTKTFWPHPDHATMEGLIHGLILKHDWFLTNEQIGKTGLT